MPYTKKAQRFLGMCSTKKGQAKARGKCPSMKTAKKLVKHSGRKK
jgi:hypothetical protein